MLCGTSSGSSENRERAKEDDNAREEAAKCDPAAVTQLSVLPVRLIVQ
jgi:hypothetical protein